MTLKQNLAHFKPLRQNAFTWLLLCTVLIAGAVRLYKLGSIPQLFNQDEMLLGYDAWSLWQTGRDHHNQPLPIFLRSFNDYVPPVANYLTAPFVGVLGLQESTTRLPFALMGTAAVLLTGLLGRRWFGNTAGLFAALFLAFDPWHVNYSRVAFPTSCVPFFTVLALYTFTRAIDCLNQYDESVSAQRRTWLWLGVSALSFALLTGTYTPLKLQAPLLFAACLISAHALFLQHRKMAVLYVFMYLLCISPLVIAQFSNWESIQSRFNTISVFNNPNWPVEAFRLYLQHYDPIALVLTGFGGSVGIRRPDIIGELFWLEAPLWLFAFIGFVRQYRIKIQTINLLLLLALWLITYPIADSLTYGDSTTNAIGRPHELRSINILPLPQLLAGYGAVVLFQLLQKSPSGKLLTRVAVAAGLIIFAAFIVLSLSYYFTPQTDADRLPYNVELRPVLDRVLADAQPCDNIWLQTTNQTYIYYLFLTRYPPQRVQQFDLTYVNSAGALEIAGFDRMSFSEPYMEQPIPPNRPECAGQPQRAYYVTKSDKEWVGWQELIAIRDPQGKLIWRGLVK